MTVHRRGDGSNVVAGPDGVNEASYRREMVLRSRVKGDAYDRMQLLADGTITSGDGTVLPAQLYPASDQRVTAAVGDNATDAAAALSADSLALATNGGRLRVPKGVYRISGRVDWYSHAMWDGDYGGRLDGIDDPRFGTVLRWIGAANGTMFRLYGVEFVNVDGLHLDGQFISGVTGLLVDSVNSPATRQLTLRHIVASNIGTYGVNGTAFQFGTPGAVADYQMDAVRLENFEIQNTFTGIRLDSYNAFSLSEIRHGVIRGGINRGIYLKRAGPMAIRHVTFGGHAGADPAFIDIEGDGHVLIDSCQSESTPSTGVAFVRTTGNSEQAIVLLNCTPANPCEFHGIRTIEVYGGYFAEDIKIYDAASIELHNVTFAAGKGVLRQSGSTGRIITHTAKSSGLPATLVDSANEGVQAHYKGSASYPHLRLQNTAPGGADVALIFASDGSFSIFDNKTSRFVFLMLPGGPTAALQISSDGLRTAGGFKHDGTQAGFFGAALASKPNVTGSRGGNVALASLISALATLGLVTNSSTA